MKIIGITGGIGSGKSTVSSYLREKGYPIIDADAIARGLTEKGNPVLGELAGEFGRDILTPEGELDRKGLAAIVFSDPVKKEILERIITDEVVAICGHEVESYRQAGAGIAFLDAPLLFETDAWKLCDVIWLVTLDNEVRIGRVMQREHCSRDEVEERIAAQMPESRKAERSDELVDNSGSLVDLHRILDGLLDKYDCI